MLAHIRLAFTKMIDWIFPTIQVDENLELEKDPLYQLYRRELGGLWP